MEFPESLANVSAVTGKKVRSLIGWKAATGEFLDKLLEQHGTGRALEQHREAAYSMYGHDETGSMTCGSTNREPVACRKLLRSVQQDESRFFDLTE